MLKNNGRAFLECLVHLPYSVAEALPFCNILHREYQMVNAYNGSSFSIED